MANWTELDTVVGLTKLDHHLADESYITGVSPSADDVTVFNALGDQQQLDAKKHPHLARWYKHISSFAPEARAAWPAGTPVPPLPGYERVHHHDIKSAAVIDVQPVSEETDLTDLESKIRAIARQGLEWKSATLVPIAFGLKKIQIMAHVVERFISVDKDIVPEIKKMDDLVKTVEVSAYYKL